MQIRTLNAGDVRVFAGLMAKNMDVLSGLSRGPNETEDEFATRVGHQIVTKVLADNVNEIWGWLADMAGMTTDEFDKQEPEAPLLVIEGIVSSGQARDFFERVQVLVVGLAKG